MPTDPKESGCPLTIKTYIELLEAIKTAPSQNLATLFPEPFYMYVKYYIWNIKLVHTSHMCFLQP